MADASQVTTQLHDEIYVTVENAISAGECRQMQDGSAGAYTGTSAVSAGTRTKFKVAGNFTVTKATGVVLLAGLPVYWDHSANAATYRKVNDRDFFIGVAESDAASDATTVSVLLNRDPKWLLDIGRDPFDTTVIGTQGLNTMGLFPRGGGHKLILSSTNEAQKVDILSKDGFAKGANAIAVFEVEVVDDGSGTVVDVSIGLANDTHATDADSITDSIFIHLNANDVNIYAESDDGTTEVAATDTTIDYTAGTRFTVWIDMRDPADVQIYINAVLALSATIFDVDASTATWKILIHVEKTAAADTYELDIDSARVLTAEQ